MLNWTPQKRSCMSSGESCKYTWHNTGTVQNIISYFNTLFKRNISMKNTDNLRWLNRLLGGHHIDRCGLRFSPWHDDMVLRWRKKNWSHDSLDFLMLIKRPQCLLNLVSGIATLDCKIAGNATSPIEPCSHAISITLAKDGFVR